MQTILNAFRGQRPRALRLLPVLRVHHRHQPRQFPPAVQAQGPPHQAPRLVCLQRMVSMTFKILTNYAQANLSPAWQAAYTKVEIVHAL